ncbi:MAG: 8-amino-7-oxononanoate synthase [Verrucomicrobiae bacterium]|nr:8-amino-7-oxononanoate synthase [Verrucomicrobiae bacterium]
MNPPLKQFCTASLAELDAEGLLRRLREVAPSCGRVLRIGGREVLNFASNDYLGLAFHPRTLAAAREAAPSGASASRLLGGNHPAYAELEGALARFKRTEAALVFSSGYSAAIGTIPALVGRGDSIVMDKLCHACLVDAARLSGATMRVFPHNNVARCGELLAACAAKGGRTLLLTESVFSMDGDLAPLDRLAELKHRYGAWFMVDEAHATGVLGATGRGGAEHFGVEDDVDVAMGTLSKALGSVGGFVAGAHELRDYLVNRARSLIFSTGLPPAVCRAATAALRVLEEDPAPRRRLRETLARVSTALGREASAPIVTVAVGDERKAVALAEELLARGGWTPAVRYPAVSRGKARLRISLSASHTDADLDWLEREVYRAFGA